TQSAMAVLTTILQLLMSFSLGWIAQRINIVAGFALLALMYGGASLFAGRERQLLSHISQRVTYVTLSVPAFTNCRRPRLKVSRLGKGNRSEDRAQCAIPREHPKLPE